MSRLAKIKSHQKHVVIQAINRLGSPVTVSDVVAATGLSLGRTGWWLNKLAAQTGAHMIVTTDGTLIYVFSPVIAEVKPTLARMLGRTTRFAAHLIEYAGRCCLGTMLLCSPLSLSIFWTLLILTVSGTVSRRCDEVFSKDSLLLAAIVLKPFLDLFGWNYNYRGKSFSSDLIRFLFGGTNPNRRLASKRWKAVGELIRANNGVLIQEQLAPYCDNTCEGNEFAMIPILVHFNGIPAVTQSGTIVYLFPEMQTSTHDKASRIRFPLTDKLLEKTWHIGSLPNGRLSLVATFTGLNLLGYMGFYEQTFFISTANPFLIWIWAYFAFGVGMIAIPVVRAVILSRRNHQIRQRNAMKIEAAQRLRNPDSELDLKLTEAYNLGYAWRNVLNLHSIYATSLNYLEQPSHEYERQWQESVTVATTSTRIAA